MDDNTLQEHLGTLHKTVVEHGNSFEFLYSLLEESLLIQIKQAYIIERLLNHALDDKPLDAEALRERLRDMRAHFERQQAIMKGEGDV